jgi:hypothetical protein
MRELAQVAAILLGAGNLDLMYHDVCLEMYVQCMLLAMKDKKRVALHVNPILIYPGPTSSLPHTPSSPVKQTCMYSTRQRQNVFALHVTYGVYASLLLFMLNAVSRGSNPDHVPSLTGALVFETLRRAVNCTPPTSCIA